MWKTGKLTWRSKEWASMTRCMAPTPPLLSPLKPGLFPTSRIAPKARDVAERYQTHHLCIRATALLPVQLGESAHHPHREVFWDSNYIGLYILIHPNRLHKIMGRCSCFLNYRRNYRVETCWGIRRRSEKFWLITGAYHKSNMGL
jgi:hypothetical protein